MPLPKAPSKLADILEDYGAPAEPEETRRPTRSARMTKRKGQTETLAASAVAASEVTLESHDQSQALDVPDAISSAASVVAAGNESTSEEKAAKSTRSTKGTKVTKRASSTKGAKKSKTTAASDAAEVKRHAMTVESSEAQDDIESVATTENADEAGKVGKTPQPSTKKAVQKEPSAKKPAKAKGAKTTKQKTADSAVDAHTPVKTAARERRGRAATPENLRKMFVLDTNVLMHDPLSLFRFDEHDVFLPMTTLEELDNHKKGLTDVARNARAVSRTLDALIEANDGQIREGVPLSLLGNIEATGRLWFETEPLEAPLPAMLPTFKGDNSILATVKGVQTAFPDCAAVLVSKDINMRIKATTLGIPAEDYFSDKALDDTDMLYTGRLLLESNFWETVASSLRSWQEGGATHYEFETDDPSRFIVNECLAVDGDEQFMAIVTAVNGRKVTMRLLKDYRAKGRFKVWGIHARNREQNMALNLLMDPEIDFVTILGQAGTGKTLMTLAAALTQTIDERRFSEIIVTRATVSVGEDIGFLPGTEEEKMAPWMGALEDNLEVLHRTDSGGEWGRQASLDLIKSRIRVKSMSFMRGRTFLQKFVIIDEAQNLSPKQMKTLITRAGPGTKIVCLGNIAQIDTPYLTEGSSGLTYVVERFQGWPHAATITLTRGERSRLAEFAAEAL